MMRIAGVRWRSGLLGMLVVAVLGVSLAAPRAGAATEERWYVLRMQGERAGWMVSRESEDERGIRRTEEEMVLRLERLGQAMEIAMTLGVVEAPDGSLVEMSRVQRMGQQPQRWTYRFGDDEVTQVVRTGPGDPQVTTLPLPEGDWLTPGEVEALVERKLAEGAESFTYDMLDVTSGLRVVTMTHRVVGPGKVEVMGKTVPGIEWEVSNSMLPGMTTREWVDDEGEMVRSAIDMGGMQMVILESDEAFARSDFDAPELMAGTMVRPRGTIESPREARQATFVVSMDGGRRPTLAEGGAQRVEWLKNDRARVTVDVDSPQEATEAEIADAAYREASTTVDSSDPEIGALVEEATAELPEGAAPEARARAMEAFVHDYISEKSLGVGFATASEVCRTREGDCSEHAVLLAAMLRADGIPSRGVSGLVYVDQFHDSRNVFGFHMWTQALLEIDGAERWVDLDAAVYPMDATHIAISTSTLSDEDMVNSMVSVAGMLRGLRITVEEVE